MENTMREPDFTLTRTWDGVSPTCNRPVFGLLVMIVVAEQDFLETGLSTKTRRV